MLEIISDYWPALIVVLLMVIWIGWEVRRALRDYKRPPVRYRFVARPDEPAHRIYGENSEVTPNAVADITLMPYKGPPITKEMRMIFGSSVVGIVAWPDSIIVQYADNSIRIYTAEEES